MKKKNNKLYPVDKVYFATALAVTLCVAVLGIFMPAPAKPEEVCTCECHLETEETVEPEIEEAVTEEPSPTTEPAAEQPPVVEPIIQEQPVVEPIVEETPVVSKVATDAEIELLALVTMAEAEGEPVEGKRLVIDTVLNRVDSPRWPNTIREVIYQPSQFVAMSNGRAERCRVTDEVRQLVREELLSRTNTEVVYFTAGGYGRYGTPMFNIGNHYFCK